MTLTEKMAKLDKAVALLRHVVRHNGAAISAKADINEVAAHFLDCDPERVKLLWLDIGTIDAVKKYLKAAQSIKLGTTAVMTGIRPLNFPDMTTEQLLEYGINDERLTSQELSWAVIKVTKKGAEILTYGGSFYQPYKTDVTLEQIASLPEVALLEDPTAYGLEEGGNYYLLEGLALEIGERYRFLYGDRQLVVTMEASDTYDAFGHGSVTGLGVDAIVKDGVAFLKATYSDGTEAAATTSITVEHYLYAAVQTGETEILRQALEAVDAAWMAETFEADVQAMNAVYTEGGVDYIQIPCDLPGDLSQLISISIERTKLEDDSEAAPLQYSLTDKSCDASNEGMVELPHGMWLIYDNSTLESAPQALLIPKDLAEGTETGYRFDKVRITYNSLASGLARLRLVGDSFGNEYIISTQEDLSGGTWRE